VFCEHALPGERLRARTTAVHARHAFAVKLATLRASPDVARPPAAAASRASCVPCCVESTANLFYGAKVPGWANARPSPVDLSCCLEDGSCCLEMTSYRPTAWQCRVTVTLHDWVHKTGKSLLLAKMGRADRVWEAAQVAARCEHFGECGGCALQHLAYPAQLREKEDQARRPCARVPLSGHERHVQRLCSVEQRLTASSPPSIT
jgi:tRNA/tmRNA/rRNA uracil-C5-methylase (TrmA/RlmC/RlmD family)